MTAQQTTFVAIEAVYGGLQVGAALTDASCFLLNGMPAAARHAFLTDVYSPSGLNLNLGRCCIGASDYSRSIYSYDDVPDDMNLDHFSLKQDEAYILPMLREILAIKPDLFTFKEMKIDVSTQGKSAGKTSTSLFGGRKVQVATHVQKQGFEDLLLSILRTK